MRGRGAGPARTRAIRTARAPPGLLPPPQVPPDPAAVAVVREEERRAAHGLREEEGRTAASSRPAELRPGPWSAPPEAGLRTPPPRRHARHRLLVGDRVPVAHHLAPPARGRREDARQGRPLPCPTDEEPLLLRGMPDAAATCVGERGGGRPHAQGPASPTAVTSMAEGRGARRHEARRRQGQGPAAPSRGQPRAHAPCSTRAGCSGRTRSAAAPPAPAPAGEPPVHVDQRTLELQQCRCRLLGPRLRRYKGGEEEDRRREQEPRHRRRHCRPSLKRGEELRTKHQQPEPGMAAS
ncbi:hypothetical protein PVAP13_4KG049833 [Panicum virgatum]|uniref:Uncharacterized protein n=1 Tax=Panicum virgatum TaxID=38727 RepID=A0A8T0TIT0_PANVG|nr:hypothetical protein PVAP13_4KG049833 [Panicum virgatum]